MVVQKPKGRGIQPQNNDTRVQHDRGCGGEITRHWSEITEGVHKIGISGKTQDIEIVFADQSPEPGKTPHFGIILMASPDLSVQTRVGYDFTTKEILVDRTRSGNVTFADTFAGVYRAPLTADQDGLVRARILLDWSSVEVFGGQGQSTITAQIFPPDNATALALYSSSTSTKSVKLSALVVCSVWS
ncbi:hypothetical protein KC340_g9064 [Hortaea werneckii]|nr:hypothetical protein KC342_g8533 [Hortaea werneckii]KAI7315145.1 hypothetical protein KC340_g9064 [Hortaea werneckii]KAI7385843.1 hypothetical protein KC328_g10141 [Hortaea werneckii]